MLKTYALTIGDEIMGCFITEHHARHVAQEQFPGQAYRIWEIHGTQFVAGECKVIDITG